MAKGKNKGNGSSEGVGKSVFLYKLGDTASVLRLPFDDKTPDTFVLGTGYKLVRTAADVVNAVAEAILSTESPRVRKALAKYVKQDVRSTVYNCMAFVVTEIVFDDVLDNLSDDKPGKKAGPVDDEEDEEDEVEDEEEVVEPAPVEPVTPTQTW